jgi:hypothetical protein
VFSQTNKESFQNLQLSMKARMLVRLWMTIFINLWNYLVAPNRPIGEAFHSNCLKPGNVNFRHSGFNIICQNPEVKLMVEKIKDPILPILSMHSWTSCIEYLFTCVF